MFNEREHGDTNGQAADNGPSAHDRPAADKSVTITVEYLGREPVEIVAQRQQQLHVIKTKAMNAVGLEVGQAAEYGLELEGADELLDDQQTLAELGIRDGTKLELLLRKESRKGADDA